MSQTYYIVEGHSSYFISNIDDCLSLMLIIKMISKFLNKDIHGDFIKPYRLFLLLGS